MGATPPSRASAPTGRPTRDRGRARLRLDRRAWALPALALAGIVAGALVAAAGGRATWRDGAWYIGLAAAGLPVVWRAMERVRAGNLATDLVAVLAIVGASVLQQPLAGLIVVLMLTGGEALEQLAERRASDAVRALEGAAPRIAHRIGADGTIEDVAVDAIRANDVLLLRPGEMVPCDSEVVDGRSHVDTSPITGEPVPVACERGVPLLSGVLNLEGSLSVRATRVANESQYARIVALVREAQASKAPLHRLADRYAIWFTPLVIAICVITWLLTRDATRVLAVLVVATPCPLILATPVAIVGGINAAARRQIIVRHGAALEGLAEVRTAIFDKTGTITIGLPVVDRVRAMPGVSEAELLHLAGSVEQGSGHLLARSVVQAARDGDVRLSAAFHVSESAGRGVAGTVEGRAVVVGSRSFLAGRHPAAAAALDGLTETARGLRAYVSADGRAVGIIEFADQVRPGAGRLVADLARLGIRRVVLLSGDAEAQTRAVAHEVGIAEAWGDLLPEDKVRLVREFAASGEGVVMIGDGTNDAPALSAATVGVAMAAHGGGIAAEAADVILLADDVSRVADALRIARRALRIARQSIWVGLALSGVAIVFATLGFIAPTVGAILQEVIDVAVIVNALRAGASQPA